MKGHLGDGGNKRKTLLVTSLIASNLFLPALAVPVHQEQQQSEWSDNRSDGPKQDYRDEAVDKALKVHNCLTIGVDCILEAAQNKVDDISEGWHESIQRKADKVKHVQAKWTDGKDRVKEIKDALFHGTDPTEEKKVDSQSGNVRTQSKKEGSQMEKRGVILISGNQQPSIHIEDAAEENQDDTSDEGADFQDHIDVLNKLKADGLIDIDQLQQPKQVQSGNDEDVVGPHLLILGVPAGPMQKRSEDKTSAFSRDNDDSDDDNDDLYDYDSEDDDDYDYESEDDYDDDDEESNRVAKRGENDTQLVRRRFVSTLVATGAGAFIGSTLADKYKRHKEKKRAKKAARKEAKERRKNKDDDRHYYKRSPNNPPRDNPGKLPMENGHVEIPVENDASASGHGNGTPQGEGAVPPPPPPPPTPPTAPPVELMEKPIPLETTTRLEKGKKYVNKLGQVLLAVGAIGGGIYLIDITHRLYQNYTAENTVAKRDIDVIEGKKRLVKRGMPPPKEILSPKQHEFYVHEPVQVTQGQKVAAKAIVGTVAAVAAVNMGLATYGAVKMATHKSHKDHHNQPHAHDSHDDHHLEQDYSDDHSLHRRDVPSDSEDEKFFDAEEGTLERRGGPTGIGGGKPSVPPPKVEVPPVAPPPPYQTPKTPPQSVLLKPVSSIRHPEGQAPQPFRIPVKSRLSLRVGAPPELIIPARPNVIEPPLTPFQRIRTPVDQAAAGNVVPQKMQTGMVQKKKSNTLAIASGIALGGAALGLTSYGGYQLYNSAQGADQVTVVKRDSMSDSAEEDEEVDIDESLERRGLKTLLGFGKSTAPPAKAEAQSLPVSQAPVTAPAANQAPVNRPTEFKYFPYGTTNAPSAKSEISMTASSSNQAPVNTQSSRNVQATPVEPLGPSRWQKAGLVTAGAGLAAGVAGLTWGIYNQVNLSNQGAKTTFVKRREDSELGSSDDYDEDDLLQRRNLGAKIEEKSSVAPAKVEAPATPVSQASVTTPPAINSNVRLSSVLEEERLTGEAERVKAEEMSIAALREKRYRQLKRLRTGVIGTALLGSAVGATGYGIYEGVEQYLPGHNEKRDLQLKSFDEASNHTILQRRDPNGKSGLGGVSSTTPLPKVDKLAIEEIPSTPVTAPAVTQQPAVNPPSSYRQRVSPLSYLEIPPRPSIFEAPSTPPSVYYTPLTSPVRSPRISEIQPAVVTPSRPLQKSNSAPQLTPSSMDRVPIKRPAVTRVNGKLVYSKSLEAAIAKERGSRMQRLGRYAAGTALLGGTLGALGYGFYEGVEDFKPRLHKRDLKEEDDEMGVPLQRRAWGLGWLGFGGKKASAPPVNVEAPVTPVTQPAVTTPPVSPSLPPPSTPKSNQPVLVSNPAAGKVNPEMAVEAGAIEQKKASRLSTASKFGIGAGVVAGAGAATYAVYNGVQGLNQIGNDDCNKREAEEDDNALLRRGVFSKGNKGMEKVKTEKKKGMSNTKKVLATAGVLGAVGTAFGIGHHYGEKRGRHNHYYYHYQKRDGEDDSFDEDNNDEFEEQYEQDSDSMTDVNAEDDALERRGLFSKGNKGAKKAEKAKGMSTTKKVLATAGVLGAVGTVYGVGHHFGEKDERRRHPHYQKRDENEDSFDEDDDNDSDEEHLEKRAPIKSWFQSWGNGKVAPPPVVETKPTTPVFSTPPSTPPTTPPAQKASVEQPVKAAADAKTDIAAKKSGSGVGLGGEIALVGGAAALLGGAGYGFARLWNGKDVYKRGIEWSREDAPRRRSLFIEEETPLMTRGEFDDVANFPNQVVSEKKQQQRRKIGEVESIRRLPGVQGVENSKRSDGQNGSITINSDNVIINQ